jgi:uncharacterized protein YndB with AHSA1/START domain
MTGYQYTVARVLDAQVEKVWRVWTQAEHYESWFHAVPRSVALDVRPGGAWRATMSAPDGSQHALTGSYREVVENRRLVTAMDIPGRGPTLMEMDLTDLDGKTQIVISQTCGSSEERDHAKAGSDLLLEWCADYLVTI